MADIGNIRALLMGIPDEVTRRILIDCFEETLGKTGVSFGTPEHQRRATNHRAFFEVSTTATSTGEFSILHGLATAPQLAIPVLDLGQPGATIVPMEVTRVADRQRIYLKSTSTSARVTFLIE